MKMITIPCELKLECNLRTRGIKGSSSPLPNFKLRNGSVGCGSHLLCVLWCMHAAVLSVLRYRTNSTGQYTYVCMFYNLNMVKNVQCRTPPICRNHLIWGAHTSELAFGKLTKTEGPPLASFICPRGIATALHSFISDPVPSLCHQAKLLMKTGHPRTSRCLLTACSSPCKGFHGRRRRAAFQQLALGYWSAPPGTQVDGFHEWIGTL